MRPERGGKMTDRENADKCPYCEKRNRLEGRDYCKSWKCRGEHYLKKDRERKRAEYVPKRSRGLEPALLT